MEHQDNEQLNDAQTELDQIESRNEAEENQFLKDIAAEAGEFDPSTVQAESGQDNSLELAMMAGMVGGGLTVAEEFIKNMVHPDFKFDEAQAEKVAEAFAPLLLKYGGEPPPWLAKYMDEITALCAVGMLGFGSYMQIKQLKSDELTQAQAEKRTQSEAASEKAAA